VYRHCTASYRTVMLCAVKVTLSPVECSIAKVWSGCSQYCQGIAIRCTVKAKFSKAKQSNGRVKRGEAVSCQGGAVFRELPQSTGVV
jgi:hypothetical protein